MAFSDDQSLSFGVDFKRPFNEFQSAAYCCAPSEGGVDPLLVNNLLPTPRCFRGQG
jgi:hypothetical protein